jgi:hypothetical protein
MAKMTEQELIAIVGAESRQALGYLNDELAADREDGWSGYLQEPYGNEVEGRSSVVSSDIQDTIEWIMPSLMRIFTAGESAVECIPQGPEDEAGAAQATDYANYVWDRDNDGFLNFYTWFKDALLSKTAFVKVYWEKRENWKKEHYDDLTDDAFALLVADQEKEIIEHSVEDEGFGPVHECVVKWKEETGKICVEAVPADEILFSRDAKGVQTCRYFAHRTRRPISDLIEEYPSKRGEIEKLPESGEGGESSEPQFRATVNEEEERTTINRSMREVWVLESYIRVDYDGDGIAEMRKITTAGGCSLVLDNEEWEGPRPFAGLSPILVPHRMVGLSVADLVKDLQLIKTTILRQYLDALYIANNPRYEVDETNVVDPAEVVTSKPGGIIRKRNGNPLMIPVATTPVSAQALEGLNYIDQMRENRTGVSPRTQGLGTNALHDTATGEQLMYSAAQSRVELVARVFAETGVKDAFKLILWLAHTYQDKGRMVRLRNQWVPMNPGEWSEQYDMTVNVGLGNGDKTKQLLALDRIAAMQIKAVEMQGGANGPLVTLENLHNTASKYVEAAELKTPELYFTDPKTQPPPQPKPDPKMMESQAKLQLQQAEMQGKQQMAQAETQAKMQADAQKSQTDMEMARYRADQDMEVARYKADQEAAVSRERMAAEYQLKREQMALEAELKREQMKWQAALGSEKNALSGISDVRPGGDVG